MFFKKAFLFNLGFKPVFKIGNKLNNWQFIPKIKFYVFYLDN